jgi:hypothetical protein
LWEIKSACYQKAADAVMDHPCLDVEYNCRGRSCRRSIGWSFRESDLTYPSQKRNQMLQRMKIK